MLTSVIAVIAYMAVVIQWSFDKGFLDYVNTTEQEEIKLLAGQIEDYYARHHNLKGLGPEPFAIMTLLAETLPEGGKKDYLQEHARRKKLPKWAKSVKNTDDSKRPHHPLMRLVLLDKNRENIFGIDYSKKSPELLPLYYQNEIIGYLGLHPPKNLTNTHQLLFVKRQKIIVTLGGLAALLITIGLSLPLAYHLTRPIRKLSRATHRLISGDYSMRIDTTSRDELGQLTEDINALAETLATNEKQRKQWLSDIAHELRTPLNSLQGQIEAVQDGIRKADGETFDHLHKEVLRLNRLVSDIYDLSISEVGGLSYHKIVIDLKQMVIEESGQKNREAERLGLSMTTDLPESPIMIQGDPQRLQQLLSNLYNNSLSYTDRGGSIESRLFSRDSKIHFELHDSLPGVPADGLPRLFDRLYRVEKSRNRELGGAGLGLAICREIVKAHGGEINASTSHLGGLKIHITLPSGIEET